MSRYSSFFLTAFVALGLLVTGCDSSGTTGESGSLALQMEDPSSTSKTNLRTRAPDQITASDIESAEVTFTEISIVASEDSSDGDSTEVGVKVLSDSNFTVDLKDLQEGVAPILADTEIPAGEYAQVRLVTAGPVDVAFTDGTTRDVRVASGQQTGLKVNFEPFAINSSDDRVEVTINWDVSDALKGSAQNFVIPPPVDATVNVMSAGN